ncbi:MULTISPECIES: regulatory protein RecX [unclassified Moraxella]|uniref:regulatory protein RecX n=1 Tax=unclassified Moraxella TaxID=2685852 RepID=UPI003AF6F079
MSNSNPQTILATIESQLMTDEERQAHHDKLKNESYMRWLAFYYLGRREQSKKELRDKLLAKDCDPQAIEALLIEFEQEGYQSDERMTSAVIKDSIGKKYGTVRIYQTLKKHGLTTIKSASGINTWIAEHSDFFNDLLVNDIENDAETQSNIEEQADYEVDWLAQAVEARCRKYGDNIPTDPKEKAHQLRFLQYRGFGMDVCFDALKYDLNSINER